MAELILLTKEIYHVHSKKITWMPKGSVISSISKKRLRDKWLEIICDLASPQKRGHMKIDTIIGQSAWQAICDHWTTDIWYQWIVANKPKKGESFGELFTSENKSQELWDTLVDSQLASIVGKEPRGERNWTDTFLWNEREKKETLIVYVEDNQTTVSEVTAFEDKNTYFKDSKPCFTAAKRVDYETDIGLSIGTISDIEDQGKILLPKYSSPVGINNVKTTTEQELLARK